MALLTNLLFPFSVIPSHLLPSPQNTEHSYKEMIVIQGHRSKELDPHEQIQNRVGNRIATPKWKHVCQVHTFKYHEHQTGFPGSRGFQCCWGRGAGVWGVTSIAPSCRKMDVNEWPRYVVCVQLQDTESIIKWAICLLVCMWCTYSRVTLDFFLHQNGVKYYGRIMSRNGLYFLTPNIDIHALFGSQLTECGQDKRPQKIVGYLNDHN